MARYAYDVNTTQRLIDVHKQFQGGLKTVDTDDALGAVFLRQAENVSLSEFGFIEKRYGTFENFKLQNNITTLQGYWEFQGHIIYAADGKLYIDDEVVTTVFEEFEDARYPDTSLLNDFSGELIDGSCQFVKFGGDLNFRVEAYSPTDPSVPNFKTGPACVVGASYYTDCIDQGDGVWNCFLYTAKVEKEFAITQLFQNTRDVNGVNINNTLYLFTGTYPIYIKEDLKVYWMPISVPDYTQIFVTGHNLLENDYENVYKFDGTKDVVQEPAPTAYIKQGFEVVKTGYAPKIPFVNGGSLDLQFDYRLGRKYPIEFTKQDGQLLHKLDLKDIRYRYTTGATDTVNTFPIDRQKIDFSPITNYQQSEQLLLQTEKVTPTPFVDIGVEEKTDVRSTQVVVDDVGNVTVLQSFYTKVETELSLKRQFVKEDLLPGDILNYKIFRETDPNEQDSQDFIYKEVLPQDMGKYFVELPEDEILYPAFNPGLPGGYNEGPTISNTFKIETFDFIITPLNSNGTLIERLKTIVTFTDFDNVDIPLVIPELPSGDAIESYQVELKIIFKHDSKQGDNENIATKRMNISKAFMTLARAERFSSNNTRYFGDTNTPPLLNFEIPELLPGTFDFIPTFEIVSYKYNSITNDLDFVERIEQQVYVSNVTITPEKTEDYQLFTGNKQNPIWSCNKVIEHFNKLMVWGSQQMPQALFYSLPDEPSYFPSYFYLDFQNDEGSALQNVSPYMNILVAQTEDRTWGIRGNSGIITSPSPYTAFTINPTVGTIAYKSVKPVRNHLFFLSKQGVIALKSLYAADEQYNIDFMDRNIRNIVPQDTRAVGIQYDNQYWLNFPQKRITLRWYIDKKAWVQDIYNGWNDFKGVFKYQVKDGKLEFISYPSKLLSGENPQVYKVGVDYSLPTDLGQTVNAKFETSYLNQNYPFHPKNYKEMKLDFTLQNEYNLGRNAVYQMDTNEDIVGNIHTIQDGLVKNHRYRLEYVFADEDITIIDGGSLDEVLDEPTYDFGTTLAVLFFAETLNLKFFTIVEGITYGVNKTLELFPIDFETVDFLLPNDYTSSDLIIKGDFTNYASGAYLRDVTYDDSLNFKTWVMSEEQTLNLDNYENYDTSLVDVGLDLTLKDRLGDWVFGESDFGNKVTAVKTIKLSGRGYNSKVYIEDVSKSKWTMESLGITYKMKRARSR